MTPKNRKTLVEYPPSCLEVDECEREVLQEMIKIKQRKNESPRTFKARCRTTLSWFHAVLFLLHEECALGIQRDGELRKEISQ